MPRNLKPRLLALGILAGSLQATGPTAVTAVPPAITEKLSLAPFYRKYLDAGGVPILASEKVSDFALLEARYLIEQMVAYRPSLLAAIASRNVRLAIMAPTEFTTDIPEHSDLTPRDYWNWRARGVGATPPQFTFSCGEENLLGYRGDPSAAENTLIHEFGHVIHQIGLQQCDRTFDQWLRETFELSLRDGLWEGTYAASDYFEYWAVGVQAWFDARHEDGGVNTRSKLKEYDPRLAELLQEVFGDGTWRYVSPSSRQPASPHLAGYDADAAPVFAWPERLKLAQADYSQAKNLRAARFIRPVPGARMDWRSPTPPRGTGSTALVFQNASPGTVQLDLIDSRGRTRRGGSLRPGEQGVAAAYPGDVWQVSNSGGWILGYFIAEPEATTAKIESVEAEN